MRPRSGASPGSRDEGEPTWLHRRRDDWVASGRPWDEYLQAFAAGHDLHPGEEVVRSLDARFVRRSYEEGPFFFPDLAGITEEDEQAAIAAGQIQAIAIRYVGASRGRTSPVS